MSPDAREYNIIPRRENGRQAARAGRRDPRRRNHVRFWRSAVTDSDGRALWIGAATFGRGVGLSHTTGQITHHIAADIDAERDKLFGNLKQTGRLEDFYWVDDFQQQREGRNGGGDRYFTDGRLAVGVIKPLP